MHWTNFVSSKNVNFLWHHFYIDIFLQYIYFMVIFVVVKSLCHSNVYNFMITLNDVKIGLIFWLNFFFHLLHPWLPFNRTSWVRIFYHWSENWWNQYLKCLKKKLPLISIYFFKNIFLFAFRPPKKNFFGQGHILYNIIKSQKSDNVIIK